VRIIVHWDAPRPAGSLPLCGESLWLHRLAQLLASKGHSPRILNTGEISNLGEPVDLVIRQHIAPWERSPHDPDPWATIPARKILSLRYVPTAAMVGRSLPNETICVPSYRYFSYCRPGHGIGSVGELPIPIGKPQPSRFSKKAVIWTGKHAHYLKPEEFTRRRQYREGLQRWLRLMEELAQEGYRTSILVGPSAPWGECLDTKAPSVEETFSLLGYDQYREYLGGFSIALTADEGGSLIDCAELGIVPLLYHGSGLGHIPGRILTALGGKAQWYQISWEKLSRRAHQLLQDPGFHKKELALLREGLAVYDEERVYEKFLELAKS